MQNHQKVRVFYPSYYYVRLADFPFRVTTLFSGLNVVLMLQVYNSFPE